MQRATITAIGHYVPPETYPNAYFESYLDTSDEWITTRTGIRERHFAKEGATSDLIVKAAQHCFDRFNVDPAKIDAIIVATATPDYLFPATACVVQDKLGLRHNTQLWGYDLLAACSSFLFALETARRLVESGQSRCVMVCGGDKMSAITDFEDRSTAVLFGDAAAVVLVEPSTDPEIGIIDAIVGIDGQGRDLLLLPAGGSAQPTTAETVAQRLHFLRQEGRAVFREAVVKMADITLEIMERNHLSAEDVDWLVPHQANMRIITATAQRAQLPMEKVMVNIDRYGNTTNATIPLCLSEALDAGKLRYGDNIIMTAFGAGFTWASIYLKWGIQ